MSTLKDLLFAHKNWIAPRSDQHTVIAVPNSRDHRKTFVEPGGSFSPGVATFGVSVWLYDRQNAQLYAPEAMPIEHLNWHWEDGYLPILNSFWHAGQIRVEQQLFAVALNNTENVVNSLKVTLYNVGHGVNNYDLYLIVRSYGPAGSRITMLCTYENREIEVNGKIAVLASEVATHSGVVSYDQEQQDISLLLRQGVVPNQQAVTDSEGLCGAVLVYSGALDENAQRELTFDFYVHPLEQNYLDRFRAYHAQPYSTKLAQIRAYWEQRLHQVLLRVPDERFHNAYYSIQAQLLMGMVQGEVRVATITYPLFWLRDSVYMIHALDKAGFHAEMRTQLELMRSRLFASGFGAEPDAFGEYIWAFFTHFQLTQDSKWLAHVYPDLQTRAEWILKVLHTSDYLYADVEMRVPQNRFVTSTDLICEPAQDGLIQGRMDWHNPRIWINAFSYLGLSAMAKIAKALNHHVDSERYQQEASILHEALHTYSRNAFGQNERDFVCAIWPTHAFSPTDDEIVQRYETWWHQVRLQGKGEYLPEPLWKYFEIGQAHNYLLLGEREKTLQTVEYYLSHHDVYQLFGWLEDNSDIGEYWSGIEGWYTLPSRQPHGWVSSELWLLLRDMLLYEDGDELILGAGIPEAWMAATTPIELLNAPSIFGPIDFHITHQECDLLYVNVRFHRLDWLPRQIQLHLPVPNASKNMCIARTAYEESGIAELTIAYNA